MRCRLEKEKGELVEDKKEDEECPSCKIAVGLGMYLNVCKELDSKETCEELFNRVIKDDISPKELFDIVKEKAKDSPAKLDMLKYIDGLIDTALEEDDGK